jgi:hypothetical protein
MTRFVSSLTSLAILLAAPLAFAQAGGAPQMSYEAVTHAPSGAWAEYETSVKGNPKVVKVRYALIEKSAKKIAIEIDTNTPPLGAVVIRMEYEPAAAATPGEWKLAHARMLAGGADAQEMPIPPNTPNLKKGDVGQVVGSSSVKTAVGTFDCKQYRATLPQGTFDLWMSDKAFPVGLVKQSDPEGKFTTVLTATGTGATTKMTAAAPAAKPAPAKSAK